MIRVLLAMLSFGFVAPVYADDKLAKAIESVKRAERILGEYTTTGASFFAQEILGLLREIKDKGVLSQKAIVGHGSDPSVKGDAVFQTGAEFGSVDHGWRIGGAIGKTHIALSVSTMEFEKNGRKVLLFSFIFPEEKTMFGQERVNEVSVTFFDFKDLGKLELSVDFNESELSEDGRTRDGMARVYTVGQTDTAPKSWSDIPFVMRATGVCYVLRNTIGE